MTRGARHLSLTPSETKHLNQTVHRQRERLYPLHRLTREQQMALIEEARAARLAYFQEQFPDQTRISRWGKPNAEASFQTQR